jgi:hypothetical protein
MPKFKVTGTRIEYYSCSTVVEAESREEAMEEAREGGTDLFASANMVLEEGKEEVEDAEEVE